MTGRKCIDRLMKTLRWALCSLLMCVQAYSLEPSDYTFKDGIALQKALASFEKRMRGETLDRDDTQLATVTLGYLRGYLGSADYAAHLAGTGRAYGIPDTISLLQISQVVSKYLADNPAKLNYPSSALVGMALKEAFPKTTPAAPATPAAK